MMLTDATCYESLLRYPTDVKLLWECCEGIYGLLSDICRLMDERMPHTKYRDVDKARLVYAKQRKPRKSETKKLRRRLKHLLERLLKEWNRLKKITGGLIALSTEQNSGSELAIWFWTSKDGFFKGEIIEHRIEVV